MATADDPVIKRVRERLVSGDITKEQATKVLQAYRRQGGQVQPSGQPQSQPEMPEGNALDAVIEPIQAIAGGAGRQAVSGLSGIAGSVMPGPEGQGLATLRQTERAIPDFAPETQAGQRGMQTLGDLMEAGIDIARVPVSGLMGLAELLGSGGDVDRAASVIEQAQTEGVGPTLGSSVMESTGSPALATAASMTPDLVGAFAGMGVSRPVAQKMADIAANRKLKNLVQPNGELTPQFQKALEDQGLTYGQVIEDLPGLPENADPTTAARNLVRAKIKRGDTSPALATKRVDDQGNVVNDPLGEQAVKQGFDPGDVQAIKNAQPGSRAAMRKMLDIRQRIAGDTRKAVDMQPTDVVGESAMKRFQYIRDRANEARQELDSIAANRLRDETIDTDQVVNAFEGSLSDLNVKLDRNSFPPRLDFKGSDIVKDRAAQKVIRDTLDLLAEDEVPTALRAHRLKRQLDTLIDYKKSAPGALTPPGERVAKTVRRSLNDAIRAESDDYARVNDVLSQSLDSINEFSDVLGPSINPFAENAVKAVGSDVARGLLSNRKSRTNLENAVTKLDQTARNLGAEFTDDMGDLVNFNGILYSKFGPTQRQSFAGQIGAEVARGAKQAAQGRSGLQEMAIEKAGEAIDKARNINDEEAYKSLRSLLRNEQ